MTPTKLLSTVVLCLVLLACMPGQEQDDAQPAVEVTTLRFGHHLPESSIQHQAAQKFADEVALRSGGSLRVEVFANRQLGSTRQMLDMAQRGEIDLILPPTAKLSHILPEIQLFDLPYLFPTETLVHRVMDSKTGNRLLARFEDHDLIGIAYWSGGFKQLTSNRPINTVKDLARLRFSTMASNLIRDQFASWGAQSVAIEFGKKLEVLKEDVVDGQENPLPAIIDMQFHEAQQYLYLSGHGYLAKVFAMSRASFEKLSAPQQQVIFDSANAITGWQRENIHQRHQQQLADLHAHPIQVAPLPPSVEKTLKAKSRRLMEQYRPLLGTEAIEEIHQLIDEHRRFDVDQLVLAIDADMSGNSALSGLAIKRGIEIAVDEINQAGGLLGKQLVVTARDNSMIPARGLDNLQRFARLPNLLAVFSGISSPVVLAELPFIHENRLLMLDPWAAATPIIDNGYEPNYVFRVSVRDEFAADFLLHNALSVSNKVGLLLVDNGWGRSNHKALLASMENRGLSVRRTEWFEWGKKDFEATLDNLFQADSEVLIFVGNPVEASKMIQALARRDNPVPVISHWGITGGYFAKQAGDALQKVDLRILQTFSFIGNLDPKVLAFVGKYHDRYATVADSDIVAPVGTAHAYDLTHLLAKAVRKAGSTESSKVRQALSTLEFHSGLVKDYNPPFTPDNHDALDRSDFILTRYKDNYLVPFIPVQSPQGEP